MQHAFKTIVNRISKGSWSIEARTEEDADRMLLNDPNKLAAHATIELLRRLSDVGTALGGAKQYGRKVIPEPENPMIAVDIEVGQKLYKPAGDLDVLEYVVIAKDEQNRLLVIRCNDFCLSYPPVPEIATEDDEFATDPAVALKQVIEESEMEANTVYEAILEAKKDIELGKPLSKWVS